MRYLLVCWLTLTATPAVSQGFAPLRGLSGVEVRVSITWQEPPRGAVTESRLQTVIELELRRAGIVVFPKTEPQLHPVLMLEMVCVDAGRGSACASHLVLFQKMLLRCDSATIIGAITWVSGLRTVTVGTDGGSAFLQEGVRDFAVEFANHFLAANPPARQ